MTRSKKAREMLEDMKYDPWEIKLRRWWRLKQWVFICKTRYLWDTSFQGYIFKKENMKLSNISFVSRTILMLGVLLVFCMAVFKEVNSDLDILLTLSMWTMGVLVQYWAVNLIIHYRYSKGPGLKPYPGDHTHVFFLLTGISILSLLLSMFIVLMRFIWLNDPS